MDAFWCITLSIIVLRKWWKHQFPKRPKFTPIATAQVVKPKSEAELQHERDVADLKRQGYSDELITTILPVIDNGG